MISNTIAGVATANPTAVALRDSLTATANAARSAPPASPAAIAPVIARIVPITQSRGGAITTAKDTHATRLQKRFFRASSAGVKPLSGTAGGE